MEHGQVTQAIYNYGGGVLGGYLRQGNNGHRVFGRRDGGVCMGRSGCIHCGGACMGCDGHAQVHGWVTTSLFGGVMAGLGSLQLGMGGHSRPAR
jgi:hypothetical protein